MSTNTELTTTVRTACAVDISAVVARGHPARQVKGMDSDTRSPGIRTLAALACVALALVPVYAVAACLLGGIVPGIRATAIEVTAITVVRVVDATTGHTIALAFVPSHTPFWRSQ
jgi:hypothetical protein